MTRLEDRVTPAGQVTGTAFFDFNTNGVLDTSPTVTNNGFGTVAGPADVGVGGVTVQAFDAAGAPQGSATTAANGTYTLNMTGTGPYRLEFGGLPAGTFYAPQGTSTATAVQFVPNGNSSGVNLGVIRPADISKNPNPELWTNIYSAGDQQGTLAAGAFLGAPTPTAAVLVRYPYSAGTTQQNNNANALPPSPTLTIQAQQIGTTWGLAHNQRTNDVYASAFTKRHAGYGPAGIGGIYRINAATGAVSVLWDAPDALVGGGAGTLNTLRGTYTDNDGYMRDGDNIGWNAVGKSGWGGLAVNDAGTVAYAMNLFDRRLYIIPINADGTADTANINSVAVPVPSNASGLLGNDIRPFAVEYWNGTVYVGMVNTGESSTVVTTQSGNDSFGNPFTDARATGNRSLLRAYVYGFTPSGLGGAFGASLLNESAATPGVRLDYERGTSYAGNDSFNTWSNTFARVDPFATGNTFEGNNTSVVKYPQPMLTGLAFDAAGNLTLGVRDRTGDATGRQNFSDPNNVVFGSNRMKEGISAGALLKAARNADGTYALESGGSVTTSTGTLTSGGATNGQGPGGGEFYFQDNYDSTTNLDTQAFNGVGGGHNDVAVGGVVAVPGAPDVLATVYDPVRQNISNNFRSGGIRWFSQTDGTVSKAYYLYTTDAPGTFGKAAGLGDLIALRQPSGREIGNRIWRDTNGNGRQDPGESGIQNVQVVLCLGGSPIATATTDANGNYFFSSNVPVGQTTGSKVFNALNQSGTYTICMSTTQSALAGLTLTTADAAGTNDENDSDATQQGSDAVATQAVPTLGTALHNTDIGLVAVPAQLSGFVYRDYGSGTAANDNNGVKDAGEAGIGGTTVTLIQVVGGVTTTVGSTTTDANGFYQFTGLTPGSGYRVVESQPATYSDGLDAAGSPGGGTTPQDDTITGITLAPGDNSQNNNFGELRGSLAGFVYEDFGSGTAANDDNGIKNTGEAGIGGATVTLVRVVGGVTSTIGSTTTGADGSYQFTDLLLGGGYRVVESQPAAYTDGKDTAGSPGGGTAGNDQIDTITLTAANLRSPNNNFGELPLLGGLSGFVYHDANTSGVRDAGDTPIGGTTVTLLRVVGGVTTTIGSTTTAADGSYQFTNLTPGAGYRVVETQPANYADGPENPGTGGGTATDNQIDGITVPANGTAATNNFGELLGAISGFVYRDFGSGTAANDDNGTKDAGETGIGGTTVTLLRVVGGVTSTIGSTTTGADGSYQFTNLFLGGGYRVVESQPAAFSDGRDTAGSPGGGTAGNDVIDTITLTDPNRVSPNNNFGELPLPAQLSGFVYEDFGAAGNNNGVKDAGEAGIAGTTVTLLRVVGGVTSTVGSTTTDATGFYQFTNLTPGAGYRVVESQPATYSDGLDTAGSPGGGTAGNDIIDLITLAPSDNSQNNNFGELLGSLAGFVYEDFGSGTAANDDNGVKDTGEAGIGGTTVTLLRVVGGVTSTIGSSTTAADGSYQFTRLLLGGGYRVVESQPAAYTDGKDTAGSPGGGTAGNDVIDLITLTAANLRSPNNNFGELQLPGSLSGFVYHDANRSGVRDAGDTPIGGTTVTLLRVVAGVTTTVGSTTTAADGSYQFTNLTPGGGYRVVETQPATYADGPENPGTGGGTATDNQIDGITVPVNGASTVNNFGELLGRISGFVYQDFGSGTAANDDNGVKNTGEAAIPGTTVTLLRIVGGVTSTVGSTTTAADGSYQFSNLFLGGGYRVVESQPAAFSDGKDTAGSPGAGTAGNDVIDLITLTDPATATTGLDSPNNNFGELPLPGTLSGFVYEDRNNSGVRDAGDTPIAGTTVTLLRIVGGVTSTIGTTTTDSTGAYQFTGLTPGAGYRVVETQPVNYADGPENPGTGGGTATDNQIDGITVPAGGASTVNNFGELLGEVRGVVYQDFGSGTAANDNNGVRDTGEAAIPGTTVTLLRIVGGVTSTVGSTTTDASGAYQFTGLPIGGGYRVVETQPSGFSDGRDTAGSPGGGTAGNDVIDTITLTDPNRVSPNNNFGELQLPGTLSGFVYHDVNGSGVRDAGDPIIPGTTVTLIRVVGGVTTTVGSTTTDSTGAYQFTNLPAGGGYRVVETQPGGFNDGPVNPGSTGGTAGTNQIDGITVPAGGSSTANNFGEVLPPVGTLNGFVYVDQNNSGVRDAGDPAIPGATVTLIRVVNGVTTTIGSAITDSAGFYQFTNLTPGDGYQVIETQPGGFLDGPVNPGSGGGTAGTNVISGVSAPSGGTAANNNFGEKQCLTLYGFVWVDVNQNGAFDPGEAGVPNATVTISGTTASGQPLTSALAGGQSLTVQTDASGRYAYTCLPAGTYTVVQTNTPGGLQDFRSQNSAPGLPVGGSTPTSFSTIGLTTNAPGPLNFGKVTPGAAVVQPGRPNPSTVSPPPAAEVSKTNFLGSSVLTGTSPPSATNPLLTDPTIGLQLTPSFTSGTGGSTPTYAVSAAGAGYLPVVRVFDYATKVEKFRFFAYDQSFTGGVNATVGDVTGDGVSDIITAAAAGGGPHVKVFDGTTGAAVRDFFAYDPAFRGGVWVAAADLNGDGKADIITGAGAGGGPHVKAFDGATGGLLQSFYAFDSSFTGGARVAAGDFNGDGRADIAAGTGAGVASQVAVFDGRSLATIGRYSPYEAAFTGGVYMAAGDINGDGIAEVITGAGEGGGPRVKAVNAVTGVVAADFFAGDSSFGGGVRVAARDINGDGRADIITGGGLGGLSTVQIFSGSGLTVLDTFYAFDSGVKTGIYVG